MREMGLSLVKNLSYASQLLNLQFIPKRRFHVEAMWIVYMYVYVSVSLKIYIVKPWYLVISVTLISLKALLYAETC
jgi:hypothetical protein